MKMAEIKRKLRFNLVDLLIMTILLALIAAGLYKFFFVNQVLQAQNGTIEFQVLLEKIRTPTIEGFKEGQKVRELQTNIELGTVVSTQPLPFREPVATHDGRIVLAEVPEKYDLIVTIQTPAVITETNITVGNKEIKTGDRISIKSNIAASTGVVYGVKVK
mgnify:CR=1 FL=1